MITEGNWNQIGTVSVGTVLTQVGTVMDFHGHPYKALFIRATGDAGTVGSLTNFTVLVSPDRNNWGTLDGTTFALLGSNSQLFFQDWNNGYRYFKAQAASDSVATVNFWWSW